MTIETLRHKYIDLMLSAVDLRPGQNLAIRTEPVHWPLCNQIAEAAYRRGARYVHVLADHPGLHKVRVENAGEDALGYVPTFLPETYRCFVEEEWAVIALVGPEDPDIHEALDPVRNAQVGKAHAETMREFRDAMQTNRFAWVVAAAPTPKWAAKVIGGPADSSAVDRLWRLMTPILRLDEDEPDKAWFEHAELLKARARRLTDLAISRLHFQSDGTDLSVGLLPQSVWIGGGSEKPDGRSFVPNIPTEEVFTTPHRLAVEGKARVTRPVLVLGRMVNGAWFEFSEGRVVDFGAERGVEALQQYFAIDENARRLGEIALVDSTSPVFESNTVFYNILYDENAACHMALGSSYPSCVDGAESLTSEEYIELGGNRANLHTDFMIGGGDISVTAYTGAGERIELIRDGRFVD